MGALYVGIKRKECGYLIIAFCIYHIAFLLIPGMFHTYFNRFPFYGYQYSEETQITSALIMLVFTISFYFGYFFIHHGRRPQPLHHNQEIGISSNRLLLVTIALALGSLLISQYIGFENLIVRRSELDRSTISSNRSLTELLLSACRSTSFLALLLAIYFRKHFRLASYIVAILLSLAAFLISNFPLALPRYILFSYALALIYVFSRPSMTNKMLLTAAFIGGILVVFPFASHITRGDGGSFQSSGLDYYTSHGDFDGLQSVNNVVDYVYANGHSYGHQLLGAAGILIPRTLWNSKPEATGIITAEHAGYPFTNISAPLASEIYIDFGFLGLAVVPVLLGIALRILELRTVHTSLAGSVLRPVAAIAFSFIIIFLRGSLIGVIANIALSIILAYGAVWFCRKHYKVRYNIRRGRTALT